jgi:hypothetical protein
MKKCSKCAEQIQVDAKLCRFCGSKQPSIDKATFAIIGGVVFVLAVVLSSGNDSSGDSNLAQQNAGTGKIALADTTNSATAVPAIPQEPASNWSYYTNDDPMSDKDIEFACVTSDNKVDLDFPYGAVAAELCVRDSAQYGRDAYIQLLDKGQILCHSYSECELMIRFDKAPARTFEGVGPSDNSSDTVFIRARNTLESNLRKADRTAIQLPFYQAGNQTFIFQTKGFDWVKGHATVALGSSPADNSE